VSTVGSVNIEISVVIGRAVMPIHQLLRMGRGAVIELETDEDEEVFVLANDVPIAKGEVILNGEKIAVSITEILKSGTLDHLDVSASQRAA